MAPGDSRLGSTNVHLSSAGIVRTGLVANNNSHIFGNASVPTGMNRVLSYGKAPDGGESATREEKHRYGVLTPSGLDNPSVSDDISFGLESILGTDIQEASDAADQLLEGLNVVMSLMGGSSNASVLNIFDAVKRENKILACSYPTFDQIRNEIQT